MKDFTGQYVRRQTAQWNGLERRTETRHIWFLNAAFDRISFNTALERVVGRVPSAPFAYIVTPNVDHLVRLRRDPSLAPLYAQAWLNVCDSRVVELLALASRTDVAAAPGADLVEALFEHAIDPDEPITVIGGAPAVIERLTARYGLTRVNWHEPPMGLRHKPDAIAACAEFVARHPARFVFLCVGSPQQEMVAEACALRGDCTGVGLCVGASLNFLSGEVKRAPRWMCQSRLEWLHRLAEQPARMWRRYLVEGPKIALIWLEWRRASGRLRAFEREIERRLARAARS